MHDHARLMSAISLVALALSVVFIWTSARALPGAISDSVALVLDSRDPGAISKIDGIISAGLVKVATVTTCLVSVPFALSCIQLLMDSKKRESREEKGDAAAL
jgi:hypothetical protein